MPSTRATTPRRALLHPSHPERICRGCDKYCPADDLACGNGSIRTPHPCELIGPDWLGAEREHDARGSRWTRGGR